jgi:hypothetical protein
MQARLRKAVKEGQTKMVLSIFFEFARLTENKAAAKFPVLGAKRIVVSGRQIVR